MTEQEARRLCRDALAANEDAAYAVIKAAGAPIWSDSLAIKALEDIASDPAAKRLLEAERFPLKRHALGGGR